MDIAAESAYPTPLANSPLLPLLLLSLATQRHYPRVSSSFKDEYDYIIVGGGSAGSVVASRLSEEPCVTVLLLEAGATKTPLLNEVPGLARFFYNTDLDWQYKTVPQTHTGYALVNKQVIWPSGKGLGGSSLLNGMHYVRGNHKDYDKWAAQGADGWSYDDVFPYFIKLEDNRNVEFLANGYHGSGGPITAENPGYNPEVKKRVLEAAEQLGYRLIDSNGPRQTGFYDNQGFIRNGQRCSTAKAYLVPVENRTNLDIVRGAHVKKINFDGSRAVGVQFDYKNSEFIVTARQEIIMSAGTINTAQLLMLSGIGPRKHLEKFNIPVVADLPVGNNLQDHCASLLPFVLNEKPIKEKLMNPKNIKEYINNRTGPLSALEFLFSMAFLGGPPEKDFPEHQIYFVEINKEVPRDQVGLIPILYKAMFGIYENGPLMVCISQLLHPRSRGTVRLQSTNPYDPPLIDPNYFDVPEDIDDIVRGMDTCRKIALTEPVRRAGVKPLATILPAITNLLPSLDQLKPLANILPGLTNLVPSIDQYFRLLTRLVVVSVSHPVGTAKMGDPSDPTTVVDTQLRVKGIQGLRVVDASVMPTIPSGHINIPTIMVAEKASDIIRETISCASDYFSSNDDDEEYAYADKTSEYDTY